MWDCIYSTWVLQPFILSLTPASELVASATWRGGRWGQEGLKEGWGRGLSPAKGSLRKEKKIQ